MYAIDVDIAALEARLAELQAQKQAEEAARANASPTMLKLAILQHSRFCQEHAPDTGKCDWFEGDNYPNDYERCHWVNAGHQRWLQIAIVGVEGGRSIGLTITEPE
jgi:hypothetical protein